MQLPLPDCMEIDFGTEVVQLGALFFDLLWILDEMEKRAGQCYGSGRGSSRDNQRRVIEPCMASH